MTLPSYAILKQKYPTVDSAAVKKAIGGGALESWLGENTCVLRMCRAFNYAGKAYQIPKAGSVHVPGTYLGQMQTVRGADKKYYGYRVAEFGRFLRANYGSPKVTVAGSAISIAPFKDKTGIIVWHVSGWSDATGHYTLWNGSAGLYEGAHDYFKDFGTSPPPPGQPKVPYLTDVQLWTC